MHESFVWYSYVDETREISQTVFSVSYRIACVIVYFMEEVLAVIFVKGF